jgi:hypothetical protein
VSRRDLTILGVLGVFGFLAGFWFLALAPKQDKLHKLDKQVGQAQQSLGSARQQAEQYAQDRLEFPQAYAALINLGKAAPTDPDMPSLLVQLEDAANRAGVDFRKVGLQPTTGPNGQPAAPIATAPAPSTTPPPSSGGTTGQSGPQTASTSSSSSSSPPASGTPGATGASGPSGTSTAPANAQATAISSAGTAVGSAQLPVLKLNLTFQGSFFKMADFIHNLRRLVYSQRNRLIVSGRLLTIDAIVFGQSDFGFPEIKATIAASAYLVPASQGILAGATPTGPGGAAPTTPTPASTASAPAPAPSAAVKLP